MNVIDKELALFRDLPTGAVFRRGAECYMKVAQVSDCDGEGYYNAVKLEEGYHYEIDEEQLVELVKGSFVVEG